MVRHLLSPSINVLVVVLYLSTGCGGAQHDDGYETTAAEELVHSESLPIPEEGGVDAESASGDSAASDTEGGPPLLSCELEVDHPAVERQLSTFVRWLRDQSVGRQVSTDDLSPLCGDQDGYLVLEIYLSGPAGGLDSLGRALPLYYPGSTWNVTDYERLEGDGVPLRVTVEVRVPTGAVPRPRCAWDATVPCP